MITMSRNRRIAMFRFLGCILFWAGGCETTQSVLDSKPVNLTLALDVPIRADFGKGRLVGYSCLFGDDGEIWAFGHLIDDRTKPARFAWMRYDGRKWSEPQNLPIGKALNDRGRIYFVTAWADVGKPMLLWCIREYSSDEQQLMQSVWDGKEWGSHRPTSGLLESGGFPPLAAARDRQGQTHCIYSSKLKPPENYGVGIDGWFPQKPFHMMLRDGRWQTPTPVMGRSRWDYADFCLAVGPRDLHFVARARYANWLVYEPSQIEHRVFRAGRWSAPDRVSDSGGNMSYPSIAVDSVGDLHLVYRLSSSSSTVANGQCRIKRRGVWLAPVALGRNGHSAIIANDRSGNIYCYWREGGYFKDTSGPSKEKEYVPGTGYIRAWTANETSRPVRLAAQKTTWYRVRFYESLKKGIYVTWQQAGSAVLMILRVTIQEKKSGFPVSLRQAKWATTSSLPVPKSLIRGCGFSFHRGVSGLASGAPVR